MTVLLTGEVLHNIHKGLKMESFKENNVIMSVNKTVNIQMFVLITWKDAPMPPRFF